MTDEPLLDVAGIDASYGKSQVLRNVSLTVDDGEVVSLLGRNGVGKTTTLRAITGVLPPEAGSITFAGEEITGLPEYQISRRGISYVAEERSIFPDLTVAENLRMGQVRGDGVLSPREVYDLLPRLEERKEFDASDLSGGEQQMLVIARALLGPTKLLLLDEPTEGLAPRIVERVVELIDHLRVEKEIPILLVEQNLNVALSSSDRCYILDKGEVVYEGATADLEADEDVQREHLGMGKTVE